MAGQNAAMRQNVYDTPELPFALYDNIPVGEEVCVGMIRSTQLQANDLSTRFFSARNVDALQEQLRSAIRKRTGYLIDRQSEEQLLIVMRYVYIQSARNYGGDQEVRRLNGLVLREIVPVVGAGLMQYLGYLRDASTLRVPLPHGQATSIKGTKPTEFTHPGM